MLLFSIRTVAGSSRVFRYFSLQNYPRFSSSSSGKMSSGRRRGGYSTRQDSPSERESTPDCESVSVPKSSMLRKDGPSLPPSASKKDRLSHIGTPSHGQTLSERVVDNVSLGLLERNSGVSSFDICKTASPGPVKLKTSLLAKNKEKRKELKDLQNGLQTRELGPGMILIKNYLSREYQVEIIKKCQALGLGPGGFYQPGYGDGGKLHLQMMCLGKNWDPELKYGDIRKTDGAKPPSIPDKFRELVEGAIQFSHKKFTADVFPTMSPDICIVNFYTNNGKLGLHQDIDETQDSLHKKIPVVSFSVGDSAEFLYGEDRDEKVAKSVILESGDVLIFGGESRLIYHGVPHILPKTAPSFLVEEANLRPGRLNLTFRQY